MADRAPLLFETHRKGSDQFAGKAWQFRSYGIDAGFLADA